MPWKNGYIPAADLFVFHRGTNSTDGDWYWALTPGTYARHLDLVERARKRTGKALTPSVGFSTYRPYASQEVARRMFGNGAAIPGTSSHGGFWEGRETLAIDYGNWSYVYSGDRATFFADVRAAGLTPNMISPGRGYPDEPWHVIDMNPRSAPAAAGSGATPFDAEEAELMGAKEDIQAMHDVTRAYIRDQVRDMFNATNQAIVERTQAQHDVTRRYLGDLGQAQHDVTRGYLVDTLTAAVGQVAVGVDAAEIRRAVEEAVAGVDVVARVDVAAIADAVNDEADQRVRDRLTEVP